MHVIIAIKRLIIKTFAQYLLNRFPGPIVINKNIGPEMRSQLSALEQLICPVDVAVLCKKETDRKFPTLSRHRQKLLSLSDT